MLRSSCETESLSLSSAGAPVGRDLLVHGRVAVRHAVDVLVPPEGAEPAGPVNDEVGWATGLEHGGPVPNLQLTTVPK